MGNCLIKSQDELHKARTALEEKDKELKSVTERLTEIQNQLEQERSITQQKEKEHAADIQSLMETNRFLNLSLTNTKKKLTESQNSLRNKQEELTSFKNRMEEQLRDSRKTETTPAPETEKLLETILQESADVRFSPQRCNPQGCEHKESMTQMRTMYEEKLKNAQSETDKKQKELKSLKDRLAAQMAASLKTGDTESMNNPVSKTRLTEMYDKLKLLQWPKVKNQLKSRNINPEEAKDLIQKTFGHASDEMKRRKQQIEEMFQQSESSSGPTLQKVKEYRQLTVQNLQMVLFHTNKEELLMTGFPECLGEFPEEVKEDLRPLTSECYWLSCLMALNNPPLQPDWENHVPGFEASWDILPREIKPPVMKRKQMQQ